MNEPFPVQLYRLGYTDLISVSPPSAALSPGSKITPSQLGKVPAVRMANGLWRGYDWRTYQTTEADVRRWVQSGANIGLRNGRFPAIDIDVTDPALAAEIKRITLEEIGYAPERIGRAPKSLLLYRTDAPFTRRRLVIHAGDGLQYIVEALGEGQQNLVHGTHPITKAPYEWPTGVPAAVELTAITAADVDRLFDRLAAELGAKGYQLHREGDLAASDRTAIDQDELLAPSDDELVKAVAAIPNTDALFPSRESYIRFGYAVKAAARDEDAGYAAFEDWALRWDNPAGNAVETVRTDWERMHRPFSIGWDYLVGLARQFGYDDAADVFATAPPLPGPPSESDAPPPAPRLRFSDRGLADYAVGLLADRLRYAPGIGKWLVWDGVRWRPDDLQRAISEVSDVLREAGRQAPSAGEQKKVESAHTLFDVMKIMRANRAMAVPVESLDSDPWLLNTPAGVVALRTGALEPNRPEHLMTKVTLVAPDFSSPAPIWEKFLGEACGGDQELVAYLQRYVGYALTGSVREQILTFVWGVGGSGKGTFLSAVQNVMGHYATTAPMTMFTRGRSDSHPTDLASLLGARLVTASENQRGKTWDEVRIKQLTGGDRVAARFMRGDYFTYEPTAKFLFVGNDPPITENLDAAIRRRLRIVGFWHPPAVVDQDLPEKLKAEYPQILAWMIRGTLAWLETGLAAPKSVLDSSEEYFEEEDLFGRWLGESTVAGGESELQDLFESWREFCGRNGKKVYGRSQEFMRELQLRGYRRGDLDIQTRRRLVGGLTLRTTWPEGA